MHPILNQIKLPPQDQQQVINLVAALLRKKQQSSTYLKQIWAGTLRDYRSTHTSLSLQKETIDNWSVKT